MIRHAAIAVAGLLTVPPVAHGQDRDRTSALVELDRESSPRLSNWFGEHWSYGGAVEIDSIAERNFDLDSAGADDQATLEPSADIGLAYEPRDDVHFYAQMEIARGIFLQDESDTRSDETRVRQRQAYLAMSVPLPGLSFQIGRQRFEDERSWWYDEDLDAVSLYYRTGRIGLELSASRNESVGDDVLDRERARRGNNFMAVGRYAYGDQAQLAAYLIAQDNRSEPREKPVFLGLRSIGAIGPAIEHWIDAAIVRGTDDGRDIRAWGFDAGAEYHFDVPLRPALHLGVAIGSGDGDLLDGVDEEFRQTGLQNSFFYYGEVLAPELSNLLIYTAGVELEPVSDATIRVLYHHYQQDRANPELRDALIDRDPEGVRRELGQALDVTVSYEGIENVYVDFIAGMFFPGSAFAPGADRAVFGQLLITYEFW